MLLERGASPFFPPLCQPWREEELGDLAPSRVKRVGDLDAWQRLALHLNGDAWTLVDCLVVLAVVDVGSDLSADLYMKAGEPDDAERTVRNAERIGAPIRAWREQSAAIRETAAGDAHRAALRRYGGALTQLLLPALGEWPEPTEYTAGRRLEYTVCMEALMMAVVAALVSVMLACFAVSLRWRFSAQGRAIPILLIPDLRSVARILALGVWVD